jgi:hypothetical protein
MARWPDFLIVGAPKAGTTSLYQYLLQQPSVFMPAMKEPHYFCPQLADNLQMQRVASQRDYLALFEPAGSTQLCGEASASYLRAPEAPRLIARAMPRAKIIILLREPGDRAFSHFQMALRSGALRGDFSTALDRWQQSDPESMRFRATAIEPGFYTPQIARYIGQFGRDNLKIIIAEEFFSNPAEVVADVLAFLGIEESVATTDFRQHNDYVAPRGPLAMALLRQKRHLRFLRPLVPAHLRWRIIRRVFNKRADKPRLTVEERQRLNDIYQADVERLRTLLGRPALWARVFTEYSGSG